MNEYNRIKDIHLIEIQKHLPDIPLSRNIEKIDHLINTCHLVIN